MNERVFIIVLRMPVSCRDINPIPSHAVPGDSGCSSRTRVFSTAPSSVIVVIVISSPILYFDNSSTNLSILIISTPLISVIMLLKFTLIAGAEL